MSFEFSDDQFLDLTERMFKEKSKGNEHFKNGEYEASGECYKNATETGEEFLKKLTYEQKNGLIHNSYYEKFISDLKFCYSNLATVFLKQNKNQEIIEIDKHIINNLDPYFDKSYARVIIIFEKLNDTENAEKFYKIMTNLFSKAIIDKYKEQFKVGKDRKNGLSSINIKANEEAPQNINNNQNNKVKNTVIAKIILFSLVFALYFFGKKYLSNLFSGSPDKAIIKDWIKNISMNKTRNVTK